MDLLHVIARPIIVGLLVALVSWLSVTLRKRKVARMEAAAPAPVEDPTQRLLREAQQFDHSRDALATEGRLAESLVQARSAAGSWHQLTQVRPGRFDAEFQGAQARLGELQQLAGQA